MPFCGFLFYPWHLKGCFLVKTKVAIVVQMPSYMDACIREHFKLQVIIYRELQVLHVADFYECMTVDLQFLTVRVDTCVQ